MTTYKDHLKTEYAHLEPREVLQRSPLILLGVSTEAETELHKLDIRTVFDLALSTVFTNASRLLESSRDVTDALAEYGFPPSDYLHDDAPPKPIVELLSQNVSILSGIGPDAGPRIQAALHVETVRDFALWPPYLAAKAIFDAAFEPEKSASYDPEAPPDLLPKSGVYPTERVFYRTIVLDEIHDDPAQLQPLEEAGPIDITSSASADFGFKKPGIGALLTYAQSWYNEGVTLGQLLHSVALAPGESTRIAMIDWSRRSRAAVDETIHETEQLTNRTHHNRSISEVTRAVAEEAQEGFSRNHVQSLSAEAGYAAGTLFLSTLFGASSGIGANTTTGNSFASSSGRRDLFASMAQNIMDSTQQYANASRNRRASVIKEVSQVESEKISTRVVTNYNHMHALSVQYYEVIQLYRVNVQLSEVEKCLFIPMKLVSFDNSDIINKYRHVLASAALSARVARMLGASPDFVYLDASTVPGITAGAPRTPTPPSSGWGRLVPRPAGGRLAPRPAPCRPPAASTTRRPWVEAPRRAVRPAAAPRHGLPRAARRAAVPCPRLPDSRSAPSTRAGAGTSSTR